MALLPRSPRYPSRFLLDIGPELLEYTRKPSDTLISQAARHIEAAERFLSASSGDNALKLGDKIRHAIFGCGTIMDIDTDKQAWTIQFENMETTRMITFRAKLERVDTPDAAGSGTTDDAPNAGEVPRAEILQEE